MSVPHFTGIHPIDVEAFHRKPQMLTSLLHYKKSQGISKVIKIHPLGNMNILNFVLIDPVDVAIFHLISKNFDLLVALKENSGVHQNYYNSYYR